MAAKRTVCVATVATPKKPAAERAEKKAQLAAEYLSVQIKIAELKKVQEVIKQQLAPLMVIGEEVTAPGIGYVKKYEGSSQLVWTEEGQHHKGLFELDAIKAKWASKQKGEPYVKGMPNRTV